MNLDFFQRLAFWSRIAGVSIADQVVFSGANFVTQVLLARWLGPEKYGAFAISFSIYLVISGLHNSLILEPMLVLGPTSYVHCLSQYVSDLIRMHLLVTGFLGFATILTALMLVHDQALKQVLIAAGLALPLNLLIWLVRRIFYLRTAPVSALRVSAVYAVAVIAGIGLLRIVDSLSAVSAWFVLGLAAGIGGLTYRILTSGKPTIEEKEYSLLAVFIKHWRFGRWIIASTLFTSGANQLQVILVGTIIGLEAAGVLRAMLSLVPPLTQVFIATGLLLVPLMARDYANGDWQALRRKTMITVIILTTISLIYEIGLIVFAKPLVLFLYGEHYLQATWLLPIVGLIGVFTAATTGFSFSLRAMQKPEHYLITAVVAGSVGFVTAISFTRLWGLTGAAASLVSYYAAGFAVTLLLYWQWAPVAPLGPQAQQKESR